MLKRNTFAWLAGRLSLLIAFCGASANAAERLGAYPIDPLRFPSPAFLPERSWPIRFTSPIRPT